MTNVAGLSTRCFKPRRWRWVCSAAVASAMVLALCWTRAIYAASGDLDPAFGIDGKVISDLGGRSNWATSLAIDVDGKIVVAGTVSAPWGGSPFELALARYNPDGSLDATFGTDGVVEGGQPAVDVAIDSNRRIVVATYTGIMRYTEDGTLDVGFGTSGIASAPCGVIKVALDTAGRIVAAGRGYAASDICVARLTENGSLDSTFGSSGFTTVAVGTLAYGAATAIDSMGRIVVVGFVYDGEQDHTVLARFNHDGTLDGGFGSSGVISANFAASDQAAAVAIDSQDRVIVAGHVVDIASYPERAFLYAARYTAHGTLDSTFNSSGLALVAFSSSSSHRGGARAVAVDGNDRIIVAGQVEDEYGWDFTLARLNRAGILDTSFGVGGKVRTDFGSGEVAHDVAIDAEGKIVVAGRTGEDHPAPSDLALARYQAGSSGYEFSGFAAPVDNPPALNVVKAGRGVPVKFSLNGYQGMDILAAGSPASQPIACQAGATLDAVEETLTATASSLSYDPATDQYTYVWKTEKTWAGSCRQFQIALADGSNHVANFQFSK